MCTETDRGIEICHLPDDKLQLTVLPCSPEDLQTILVMKPVWGPAGAQAPAARAALCCTQQDPADPEQGTAEPTARIVRKNVTKSPGRAGGGDPCSPADPMEKHEEEGVAERNCCGVITAPVPQPCSSGGGGGFGIEEVSVLCFLSLFLTIQLCLNCR